MGIGIWAPVWRAKSLCLPNEDFGKRNRGSGVSFRVILQVFVAQIEYTHPSKVPRKDTPDLLFRFPKSSFGEHRFVLNIYKTRYRTSRGESNRSMYDDACLCSPNEDFGKRNSGLGVSFRVILRAFVAQIQYSHPRKVPRKHTPDLLFRFPKSSFGEHKLVIEVDD